MSINPSQSQFCPFECDVRLCIFLDQVSRKRIYVDTKLWVGDKICSWNHKKHTDTENDRLKSPRIISCISFPINGPGTYFPCQTQCWWPNSCRWGDDHCDDQWSSSDHMCKDSCLWLVSHLPPALWLATQAIMGWDTDPSIHTEHVGSGQVRRPAQ